MLDNQAILIADKLYCTVPFRAVRMSTRGLPSAREFRSKNQEIVS
jgi:hypothetical protein